MGKGQQQLTKGQRFEKMEKELKNLQMSSRVSQMMLQQVGNTISPIQGDLKQTVGRQRELQYRVLAMQELLNVSIEDIEAKSLELQIKDFYETSDKEDIDLEYTVADIVAEDSVVIVTSTTPDEEIDKGLLRSKLKYEDIGIPTLKEALLGRKVGDKLDVDVQGVTHKIEVLGIRTAPTMPESEEDQAPLSIIPDGDSNDGESKQA